MTERSIETNTKRVKARYISDIPSIFFKKGEVYEGFLLLRYKIPRLISFYFTEEEMDEEGYYALPADRFEIIEE